MIDGGATRSFVLGEVVRSMGLKVVNGEELTVHTFGNRDAQKRIYDIVEIILHKVDDTNKRVKINAVVVDSITLGKIEVPSQWVRNIAFEKDIELADLGTCDGIQVLIGADYIWDVLGERNVRISKKLVATNSIFGYVILGMDEGCNNKDVHINYVSVVSQELDRERVKTLWELEAIGISPNKEKSRSDHEISELFEQNTTYDNERYETRLLWKEGIQKVNSNFEIAKRRLLSLSHKLEKNEELYLKYDEIIQEHLKEGIVERTEYVRENLKTGYYMPHHAVVR